MDFTRGITRSVHNLPPALAIPGLVRVATLPSSSRLELGGPPRLRVLNSGEVMVRSRSSDHLLVVDEQLRERDRIELAELSKALDVALDRERDVFAIASDNALRMVDMTGRTRWVWSYPNRVTGRSAACRISSDGALVWLLLNSGEYLKRGDQLVCVDAETGRVLVEHTIDIALSEGPSWTLGEPHSSDPTIFVDGGMGQDDTITVQVGYGAHKLVMDEGLRSFVHVAFDTAGAHAAFLSHYGDQLRWESYPERSVASTRDLSPVFEALDDGHNWIACSAGARRLIMPSCEGRLLLVDPVEDEVVELRCDGDERNWDWCSVAVVGGTLLTARSDDHSLCSWDLSTVNPEP